MVNRKKKVDIVTIKQDTKCCRFFHIIIIRMYKTGTTNNISIYSISQNIYLPIADFALHLQSTFEFGAHHYT